jgi:hypothetical protein
MRLLPASGIVRLVALVFLLIFSSSLQQQAGVGKSFSDQHDQLS